MREFTEKLHRDLGPTRLWGYNGMYPGPTFDVIKGETTYVKWMSDLPTKHFLPIDTTIHGADKTLPEVRTVVHLHGGKQPASSDGYPEVGLREILNKRDLCLKEKYMSTRTLKPLPYGIMIIQWELRD
jgi:FtsP/CotA-like multicopper oxidase with cupredoxin domain